MHDRLTAGDSLILFPEGTTSDGSRVMPISARPSWRSPSSRPPRMAASRWYSRFPWSMTGSPGCRPGGPAGRCSPGTATWISASHFWRLAQHRGLRVTVLLHAPLDPAHFPDRKALAQATWAAVADGASALRQNRPVEPTPAAEPLMDAGSHAFA